MSNNLKHHGVKGMKWGVRRYQPYPKGHKRRKESLNSLKEKAIAKTYDVGVKIAPRERTYAIKRALNRVDSTMAEVSKMTLKEARSKSVLPTDQKLLDNIEKAGIEKHKAAKYDLSDNDIQKLTKYTNSARYSRNINSYLAIGEPKHYADSAQDLKNTLQKTRVNDTTVFRSTNIKFSFDGISKKLDTMSEDELAASFGSFSKNYKGKTFKENRVFSTSTSPNFAIDTWRKVNPTAAKSYNTYMILNTENCPGLLADGRTTKGKKIVNTRSNQEGILAPSKIRYDGLSFDSERQMFVITATAMGDD